MVGKSFNVQKKLSGLSQRELRELVLINSYKLAITRSKLDAVVDLVVKNKVASYEDIWRLTQENFSKNIEEEIVESSKSSNFKRKVVKKSVSKKRILSKKGVVKKKTVKKK